MDKERLLGWTPYIELIIRKIYYSNNPIVRMMISRVINLKKQKSVERIEAQDHSNEVYDYILNLQINQGDILILHSSKEELDIVGVNVIELFEYLRRLVGEEGTLVFPTFPLYTDNNYRIHEDAHEYNPKRTLCSTGMIPNLFLRMRGVMRSEFPWNTLAAQGSSVTEMMVSNLETDLAHGKGSAWHYCYKKHAKILLLGVKASSTTTMIHVAEDLLDDKWPIKDWYEKKKVIIKLKDEEREYKFRVRKQKWAKYNASWYRSNQLKKQKILKEDSVAGLNIGFINDSKQMVNYIIERNRKHKGFFVVPRKYYK